MIIIIETDPFLPCHPRRRRRIKWLTRQTDRNNKLREFLAAAADDVDDDGGGGDVDDFRVRAKDLYMYVTTT